VKYGLGRGVKCEITVLFNLEKPVVLSVEQFDTYWPLTDAVWSNRMVRKRKKTGPTLRKKKAGW
jgi:hypothetical protein